VKVGEGSYIVSGGPGQVKVRWLEWPPHAPTTVDMLPEKCLSGDGVDMELLVNGGFRVGHFNSSEVKYVGSEKSGEGKSEKVVMSRTIHPANSYIRFRTLCSGPMKWYVGQPSHARNKNLGDGTCIQLPTSNNEMEAGQIAEEIRNLNQILFVSCDTLV
jgi:hypothetical protein